MFPLPRCFEPQNSIAEPAVLDSGEEPMVGAFVVKNGPAENDKMSPRDFHSTSLEFFRGDASGGGVKNWDNLPKVHPFGFFQGCGAAVDSCGTREGFIGLALAMSSLHD